MRTGLGTLAGILCLVLFAAGCSGEDDEGTPAAKRTAPEAEAGDPPDGEPRERDAPAQGEARPPSDEEETRSAGDDEADTPHSEPRSRAAAPVRATLRTFLEGMSDGDPGTVCSTYTREVRALVGRTLSADCVTGMDLAFRTFGVNPRAFRGVRVTRVRVTRDRAVAQLFLPARLRALPMLQIIAPRRQLTLEREAGRWRLGLALL